jgi:hypothetical protein
VAEVATKAKAALPECNSRVESAVRLVLAGDVELLPDGKAKVASQSNGQTTYHIVNGSCDCKDFPQAPHGFCKHKLAYGIHKRSMLLAKAKLAQLDHQGSPQHAPVTAQDAPQSTISPQDVEQLSFRGSRCSPCY